VTPAAERAEDVGGLTGAPADAGLVISDKVVTPASKTILISAPTIQNAGAGLRRRRGRRDERPIDTALAPSAMPL